MGVLKKVLAVFLSWCMIFMTGCMPSSFQREGDARYKDGNYKEAVGLYQQALTEDPENTKAMNKLAASYLHLGQYEDARKQAAQSLEIDGGQPEAILHLGSAYLGLENYKAAEQTWKKYKDDNQPKVTEELTRIMTLLRYKVAEQDAEKLVAGTMAAPMIPNSVAVIDFEDATADQSMSAVQKGLSAVLVEQLQTVKGLIVIDRVQALAIKRAVEKSQPGLSYDQVAMQVKKLTGAESIIMGKLSKGSFVADSVFKGTVDGMITVKLSEADLFKMPDLILDKFCDSCATQTDIVCPGFKTSTPDSSTFIAKGKTTEKMDRGEYGEAYQTAKKSGGDTRRIPTTIVSLNAMAIITLLLVSIVLIAIVPTIGSGEGGGGGGCFAPDTLVLMADGSSKRILDVRIGDTVKAYDTKAGKKVDAKVIDTHSGVGDHHYIVNGNIRVTPPHPFYTQDNQWVKLADLKAGQDVRISSSFSKIETLKKMDTGFKIFNITVENYGNFYVSGDGKKFFLVKQGD